MKNSSNLRNANILAGIFFILLAFWQFIDRLELGFLDLEWLVSIYSESLITAVVCFIMAIFCFIGKKNIYLVVVTGCATLGIFVANYSGIEFLAFDTFLCLPILILFATEIFSIKGIITPERKLMRWIWVVPFIIILPIIINFIFLSISVNDIWDFKWTSIHYILYGISCSFATLWCLYAPFSVTEKATNIVVESVTDLTTPTVKYCTTCGKEIHVNAVICPNCGCAVQNLQNQKKDIPNTGLKILSFLIPLAGLILFCVNIGSKPVSAKSYGIWALISVLAGFILAVCTIII